MAKKDESKRALIEPWRVMEHLIPRGWADAIASRLTVSPQLVRAWRREPEGSAEYESTGRLSPLDRLQRIVEYVLANDLNPSRAYPLGHHIAALLGGVFMPLPACPNGNNSAFLAYVAEVLRVTSGVVERVRVAYLEESPGEFTSPEIIEIREQVSAAIGALHRLQQWTESK